MIETKRLILRPFTDADIGTFASFTSDPEVMHFYPEVQTREQAEQWLKSCNERFEKNGFHMMAVERKSDGVLLGLAGCGRISYDVPGPSDVEAGWLFGKQYWGQRLSNRGCKRSNRPHIRQFRRARDCCDHIPQQLAISQSDGKARVQAQSVARL